MTNLQNSVDPRDINQEQYSISFSAQTYRNVKASETGINIPVDLCAWERNVGFYLIPDERHEYRTTFKQIYQ